MAKRHPDPTDVSVGAKIREKRLANGMSQQALGEAIGLTFQQVQKYEKGTNRVGSSRMMQIANALGVEPTAFFEGLPKAKQTSKTISADYVAGFVASSEGLKLIKAFQKMPKGMRLSIVKLVEKIAESQ